MADKGLYLLILCSVSASAAAQVSLKAGMTSSTVVRSLGNGFSFATIFDVMFNPLVLLGLFLYATSMAFWLFVLSKMELSTAYPFVSLGFVLTAIMGRLVFHDSMSTGKVLGTMLIMSGVVVLSRG